MPFVCIYLTWSKLVDGGQTFFFYRSDRVDRWSEAKGSGQPEVLIEKQHLEVYKGHGWVKVGGDRSYKSLILRSQSTQNS